MAFNLFGKDRPPAPEVATAEDVEQYNLEFAKSNGVIPRFDNRRTDADPEQAGFAKQPDDQQADRTKHKSEFPWLFDPSRGVRWDFNPVGLRNIAQTDTWVSMLISTITKEIAETPWTIVKSDGRVETQKRLNTHPEERTPVEKDLPDSTAEEIYDTLMHPNPDETWHDLVEQWYADLLEVGSMTGVKSFHRRAYDGEEFVGDPRQFKPRAIRASAPEVWTKEFDKAANIEGYWQFENHAAPGSGDPDGGQTSVRGIRDPTFFDINEVMWDDMNPRSNRRYGIPPTLPIQDFLQSVDLALTQEQQYLSRGSIPSGAWVFEEWDREQLKERRTEMQENVKGKPHKSLMFAGQGGDVSFEPMSMNFQELEFTERMKWYARVIASAFQVPTAVVGIEPERVNYNTFQGERQNFESNTLGPYLQQGERWITHNFIRPHWGPDYRFEFKPGMSETTRGMISDRVRKEFNAGLIRRNEARRETGREEVDEELDGFKDEVVEDTSPADAEDGLGDLVSNDADGDSGNANLRKDEPLRNTDEWYNFTVQPNDIEPLAEEIASDVDELFERVLDDDEVRQIIDRLAAEDTEKSLAALSRRLRDLFAESDIVARIEDALRDGTAEMVEESISAALADADTDASETDVDIEAIREQLADRSVEFADSFANDLSEDIRETVGDGWQEGQSSREIAEEISQQADINEGWTGAERIARQEMHVAAASARSEVAADLGKVEVWQTSQDNRVRPAHEQMQGAWKRPGETWEVEYEGGVVVEESVPGDSERGIGCRCNTLLRDIESVDESNHAGV